MVQRRKQLVPSLKKCRSSLCKVRHGLARQDPSSCEGSSPHFLCTDCTCEHPCDQTPSIPSYQLLSCNRQIACLPVAPESRGLGKCACTKQCDLGSCLNAVMLIECGPSNCSVRKSSLCKNRQFADAQAGKLDQLAEVFWTGDYKGFGLRATTHIARGKLIAEYLGEIVPQSSVQNWRYIMALPQGFAIHASMAGGPARFINHSCDPNCNAQRWLVEGRWHVGIFSHQDIKPQEEITFSYSNGRSRGSDPCHCGSSLCTGRIANPPRKYKKFQEAPDADVVLQEVPEQVEAYEVESASEESEEVEADDWIVEVKENQAVEVLEPDDRRDEPAKECEGGVEEVACVTASIAAECTVQDEGSMTLQDLLRTSCNTAARTTRAAEQENLVQCEGAGPDRKTFCETFFAGSRSWHQAPIEAKQIMQQQNLPEESEQIAALSLGLYLPSALCLSRGLQIENSKC
ncbi:unnamed protein product [Durusdinium trenchii]|uniref:Uncharacterized protein n=2 Tax=Durusdinium trenchii TaxID=1381693 RepID=A0ABP0QZS7_9DINO